MRIDEAIAEITDTKPHQIGESTLVTYLSRLDMQIKKELYDTHEGFEAYKEWEPYTEETDWRTELLVPAPYDELYIHFLAAKVDLINQEMEKYNNNITLYNNLYNAYAAYYNRQHMHLQTKYKAY